MGMTTEEESVSFGFWFLFLSDGMEGRIGISADDGSEQAGWPSDEETLEIRVDRIEEKP